MGLTGGIADVGSLFDAMLALKEGKADDSILDKYSDIRRQKWAEIIDPMSRANFKRVCLDESEESRNGFWDLCRKMEQDDEMAKKMAEGTNVLREDFSDYLKVSMAQAVA
jgi:hypothetical protein